MLYKKRSLTPPLFLMHISLFSLRGDRCRSLLVVVGLSACARSETTTTLVTPSVTVPGAPTNIVATAGNTTASLVFTVPSSTGGSTILAYTATCSASGVAKTGIDTRSPITVTGLVNETSYACTVAASNAQGLGIASASVVVKPSAGEGSTLFSFASATVTNGGTLPATYTCDGTASTLALQWANAPVGTKEFALLMTTLPGDGTTKWNWVLYGIPPTTASLAKDSSGVGTLGVGSDGPALAYNPPCSQGPGAKVYTYTLYALSAAPTVSETASQVTGQALTIAIASLTLASASFNVTSTRPTFTTAANCAFVRGSMTIATTGVTSVGCDSVYAYINTDGLAAHAMMNGIVATNLQVPLSQAFIGANAWKIPLTPAIAASTTAVDDGPIGIAVNGVPIFNPCKQGGCQNGDTKVLGELDNCNGHAGRADDYHYHAAPLCLMSTRAANYWDTHPLGWALDGYAIFGFNNTDGTVATRDNVCGGNTNAVQNAPTGYSYHVTNTAPYVLACLRGTPSPDLAGQGGKYRPMRQPPVTPFPNSAMTLVTDATDGYQVLQFTSARTFTTTETGADSYVNAAGTYRIRYKAVAGVALVTLLAQSANVGKNACWNFQFVSSTGATTQPTISYCR